MKMKSGFSSNNFDHFQKSKNQVKGFLPHMTQLDFSPINKQIQLDAQYEVRLGDQSNKYDQDSEGGIAVENLPLVATPKMYKVLLLNDDFTPMDFVVLTLKRFFGKNEQEAIRIMLDVHKKGAGIAGVFTLEIAEMKVMQSNQFAQSNQYPLKTTLEEA